MVDALLDAGFEAVTVLDLADKAIAISKVQLGARGAKVRWIIADVTTWDPSQTYDVWHDRAVFHFLIDPSDRAAYATRVLKGGGPAAMLSLGHSLRKVPNDAVAYPSFVTTPRRLV